ncbi:MAG: hypothetical protein ACXVX6_06935 [Mycobacterium sp.]
MQERYLKVDVNFSWHLVWLFALLEGITVPLVPLFLKSGPRVNSTAHTATVAAQFVSFTYKMIIIGIYGIAIGFIGASIVCLLLNYIVFRKVKIQLNNADIVRVPRPFVVALWGGLLLAVIFWIQQCIGSLLAFSLVVNLMLLGFVSAAGSITITSCIYFLMIKAVPRLGIQLLTTKQRLWLAKAPILSFAVLGGLYEGLAAPILQRWELAPQHKMLIALLVGFTGGALSSLIVVALAHIRAINKHIWLKFSIIGR